MSLPGIARAQSRQNANYTTGNRGLIVVHKLAHVVTFHDPKTLAQLKEIEVGLNPHELVISPDKQRAYVAIYATGVFGHLIKPNHQIAIFNLASRSLEGYIDIAPLLGPHGLMFDNSGLLWVTCDVSAHIAVVDVAQRKVLTSIPTGSTGSHFATMLTDGSRLFVSNKSTPYVSVIDVASRKVVHRMPNPDGTDGLCTSLDGRYVFLSDLEKPMLRIVDTSSMTIVRDVPLRNETGHAARVRVSLDGRYLVASNYEKSLVTVMPMHDLHSQKTMSVEKGPMGFAFPTVPDRALVTNHDAGYISALDLAAGKVLRTYRTPQGAESLSYY
jgi:DNA-binding beta-propeller fold protein YncE